MRLFRGVQIFQSTPPRRRRRYSEDGISFHRDFNPRLREGGDWNIISQARALTIFQSTPPRRRRRRSRIIRVSDPDFNPRLREGGDLLLLRQKQQKLQISIHASEKEATAKREVSAELIEFQSTPPRRRRRIFSIHLIPFFKFQSTPPRRRRLQHIVIPQLSCTYLVSTTFLSTIFSFISQYIVLFFLF